MQCTEACCANMTAALQRERRWLVFMLWGVVVVVVPLSLLQAAVVDCLRKKKINSTAHSYESLILRQKKNCVVFL